MSSDENVRHHFLLRRLLHLRVRRETRSGRGLLPGVEVYTRFSRFVAFLAGSSICLAYLTASLVNRGLIGWGEYGTTIVAYSCIFLIIWDLLFLLEYMSVLYEMDDEGEDEE
jgi:hypothetical protein